MTEPIEFFFDVVSPFGWFSAERVGGLPIGWLTIMAPIESSSLR